MTMPYICCQFQKRVSRNERSVLDDHGNRVVRLDEDYADSQRFAMNIGNETFFLFGDQLGSTSGVMNASGQIVEKGYYLAVFLFGLFAAVALQKNVRDLAAYNRLHPEAGTPPEPKRPEKGAPPLP